MKLSKHDARKIFLKQRDLLQNYAFGQGTNCELQAFSQLSYLEIDTISVVGRIQDNVLRSGIKNFDSAMLDKLMLQWSGYEYWSHVLA